MNQNIKTMRRVRHTHAKFAALNAASAPLEDEDHGGEGGLYGGNVTARGPGTSTFGSGFGVGDDEIVDDRIDEAPWTPGRGKGKRKMKRFGGVEIGVENAADCLNWSTNKILEHEGFQGAFFYLFLTHFNVCG
jgi:transcriptional activator SPT7